MAVETESKVFQNERLLRIVTPKIDEKKTKTELSGSADKHVKESKRKTRRKSFAKEKMRNVLDELREESLISKSLSYNCSKGFVEAGKTRLAGKCTREQTIPTVRSSAYGAMLIDYDAKRLISQKQYFRKPGSAVWKTQVLGGYKRVGNTWQPARTDMVVYNAGIETRIQWKDCVLNAGMDAAQFCAN